MIYGLKVNDLVRYKSSQRRKEIEYKVGVVVATKQDNEFEEVKLRKDEVLVDFGFEDDNCYVCRIKDIVLAGGKVDD